MVRRDFSLAYLKCGIRIMHPTISFRMFELVTQALTSTSSRDYNSFDSKLLPLRRTV